MAETFSAAFATIPWLACRPAARAEEVNMRNATIWGLALSALAACGSDDNDGPPRYQSGITASGPVASLDNRQLQQICSSFDAYVDTNVGFDQIAYIACLPPALV